MLSLSEVQNQFADALNEMNTAILTHIQTSTHSSAAEHIAVYQHSVTGSLQNTLKEIFPVCLKLVGDDFFIAMINHYIAQTPSRSPDLGDYGETFAQFIAEFTPAASLPYLSDVARLEWAWHRIFEAADAKQIDFQKLAECYESAGEHIIFSLPPTCFLLTSHYPIDQIWEVNQTTYQGDSPITLKNNQTYYFLIWRHGLEMRIDILSETEWFVLNWMRDEFTLNNICEKLHDAFPHADITELLVSFVSHGWLTDFRIKHE